MLLKFFLVEERQLNWRTKNIKGLYRILGGFLVYFMIGQNSGKITEFIHWTITGNITKTRAIERKQEKKKSNVEFIIASYFHWTALIICIILGKKKIIWQI